MVRRRGCELSTCCGTTRSSLRLLAFQPEWRLCPLSQSLHPSTLWSLFLSCAHRPSTRLHTIPSHCRPASFHVTCGRAPPHHPLAGSGLQWESRPQGATPPSTAPHLHKPKRRHTQVSSGYMPCVEYVGGSGRMLCADAPHHTTRWPDPNGSGGADPEERAPPSTAPHLHKLK